MMWNIKGPKKKKFDSASAFELQITHAVSSWGHWAKFSTKIKKNDFFCLEPS